MSSNTDRNDELRPGFNKTQWSVIKGKRLFNVVSLLKKEAHPNDTYYVVMPSLSPSQVLIPDTMNLTFKFKCSNTKSVFQNNLSRLLCDGLSVRVGGEVAYDNIGEGLFERYRDLWLSDSKRANMIEYGIANENIRKLMSKDDSATTANKDDDVLMVKNQEFMKIKLGKILTGHGPYAPYDMSDFEYRIKLPESKKVMNAQSGETLGDYKLTDINLEFETIEGEELTQSVKDGYEVGRQLWYDYTTLLKTLEWSKSSTREVIDINIPRKSMKSIVLLCTKKSPTDSEEFVNAEVEKVKVTIEGNPNSVYSQGLVRSEVYDEARRFFGTTNDLCNDNLSKLEFLKDKYALVIDLRTVDDENTVHSGRKLIGTQSGVLLEIEKLATTVDLLCHVFVVSDGHIVVSDGKLQKIEY